MSQRRNRLPLLILVLVLISAGDLLAAPAQEVARPRGPSLVFRVLDLLPERLERWVTRQLLGSRPLPSRPKCSGGIDPDGKPCPTIP